MFVFSRSLFCKEVLKLVTSTRAMPMLAVASWIQVMSYPVDRTRPVALKSKASTVEASADDGRRANGLKAYSAQESRFLMFVSLQYSLFSRRCPPRGLCPCTTAQEAS